MKTANALLLGQGILEDMFTEAEQLFWIVVKYSKLQHMIYLLYEGGREILKETQSLYDDKGID